MKLPSINIDHMDIKLNLEGFVLNVLYVKFGYFYRPMPEHSHSHNSYELHYIPAVTAPCTRKENAMRLHPARYM
ncbi:hypothetical protein [Paenibacillus sp. DMB5]|uniref:hypothetical protein n=1 Tax=Paenibacillus sp. DMB5 TaxID=1780103 RepID=UPI00076C6474|nr:hypothetical protein [Paenibacillus sp. DMB5]KUP25124.1 hypothetical protein AWJ19_29480 [Paenibacillus sp. DMB5]